MTRKTQKAYEHALRYVNENIFPLKCEAIITDYEIAMRQAIKNVVPGIKLLGCWFHFAQAIRRKVASLSELFEIVRKDPTIRSIYYKFICLALLPHEKIHKAFNELALEALRSTKAFTPFVKYFQNQWLMRVGAKNFSVFLEETRTTCAAEGYNGKLGKKFQTHPNFFVFIESLQLEEFSKSNALEQHINGDKQTQPKKLYRERAAQIRNESIKFEIPNQTNAQLFLNRMANTKNRMLPTQFEQFEDIVAYVDSNEEVLDDIYAENDITHSDISKEDNDAKHSKQIRNVIKSKEPKSHSAVNCSDTINPKDDDVPKHPKQTRKVTKPKDRESHAVVGLTIDDMKNKGVMTRSQLKKFISNGQK